MRWGAAVLVFWIGLGSASAGELPSPIERILAGHDIDPNAVSIVVQAVGSSTPILSHLPDTPRNPASVMKLVTTWSALQVLGPAFKWPTEVYFLGDFDGSTLHGDLALKGYGDPFLVIEKFWKLLRGMRDIGLAKIDGNLIFDDSYFDVHEDDPGAFDGQSFRTYNVVPNALLLNFEAVDFKVRADPAHKRVNLVAAPALPNLQVRNRIKLASGPCRGYQYGVSFNVVDTEFANVVLGGDFPASCESYSLARSVLKPDTYAYGLFRMLWKEVGGEFHGKLRHEAVPQGAAPVITWYSPSLADVIRSVNKYSNNLMARQLLYTLGAVKRGAPGTRQKGVEAIRDFLAGGGLDVGYLVMDNGSGLSRDGRVTAGFLADLLQHAQAGPYAAEFVSSLSLAGLDGTARNVFDDMPVTDGMHLKTGTLDQVSALAGYVRALDGADYIVVVLLNSPDADRGPGHELERATLSWVVSQTRGR